ncbi:MAG: hypothetical protein R3F44_13190 [Candidatus Competibacteraceae bacterium]
MASHGFGEYHGYRCPLIHWSAEEMKFLLTIVICAMSLVSATVHGAEESTVKLGALYNLTGGMSAIDAPACRGSLLAVKLLNKKGGGQPGEPWNWS